MRTVVTEDGLTLQLFGYDDLYGAVSETLAGTDDGEGLGDGTDDLVYWRDGQYYDAEGHVVATDPLDGGPVTE